MRRVPYFVVDVFTDRPLAGNPLAVFPDRSELAEEELLQVARELNLSETVFVEEPAREGALRRLRIFTPGKEIPLAGHPVVGTWFLLASKGLVDLDGAVESGLARIGEGPGDSESVVFMHELSAGVLPLTVYRAGGEIVGVAMDQVPPKFSDEIADIGLVAAALNIEEESIRGSGLPPQVVSTGIRIMMAPVSSLSDLQSIRLNAAVFSDLVAREGAEGIYAFTLDAPEDWAFVRTRGFFPDLGVPEDPATGSAAGCLGGYLAGQNVIHPEPTKAFQVAQGFEIDRPSSIGVEVTAEGGEITRVRVVGSAVVVAEAELLLPD